MSNVLPRSVLKLRSLGCIFADFCYFCWSDQQFDPLEAACHRLRSGRFQATAAGAVTGAAALGASGGATGLASGAAIGTALGSLGALPAALRIAGWSPW